MRARSGVVALVPIASATALLAFCLAGARLYASSSGSAAFDQQLSETCASDSALNLPILNERDEAAVMEIAADLQFVQPARRATAADVELVTESGSRSLLLLHLTGVEEVVSPALADLALGEIALSELNTRELATAVGAELTTLSGARLTVTQQFANVPFSPVPDYWCGQSELFEPTAGGDPPPPFAIASRETIAQYGGFMYDEFRVSTQPMTLTDMEATEQSFDQATERWNARFATEFVRLQPNELPRIAGRTRAVFATVERSLAPVLLTAIVAVFVVLISAAVLLARAQARELKLLAVRGLGPARIGAGRLGPVAVAVGVGAALGYALAHGLVAAFGPSTTIESSAIRGALAGVGVAAALSVPLVAGVVGVVGDRAVDRSARGVGGRWVWGVVTRARAGLAVASFRRLDRDGGIRTFGVESRGGDLLPMGFPLFALLASAALLAMAVALAAPAVRMTGGRLGRSVRLGWRRVVLESGPLVAIVMAVTVAAGCLATASSLSSAARRQLADKALVYTGADLAVNVYDDPVVDAGWADRTSLALTARGRAGGESFELLGVDRSTFAAVARLRSDATPQRLPELVDALAPVAGEPAPAIAVGSENEVGDIVTFDLPGSDAPVDVRVIQTLDFFPSKSSGFVQFVVDDTVVDSAAPVPVRVLFVDDPPPDAVEQLRDAGVRTGVVRSVDSAFDGSAYSALRWSYTPLAALGVLFAVVALALQLLVVAARAPTRRATHAVMRRTDFGARRLFGASIVETTVPLVLGTVCGVAASAAAGSLAVRRLDPLTALQPPALFAMPWTTIAGIAVALPIWILAIATAITRSTVRADPLEVLHGAL